MMMLTVFVGSLAVFLGIGVWASSRLRNTTEDYLLAGRTVNPWFVAVSAAATDYSGFMYIGYVGFVYAQGVSGLWLFAGFVAGELLLWPWVPAFMQRAAGRGGVQTFSALIGHVRGKRSELVVRIVAVSTILFLGIYAAAQLKAGGKALHALLGWPEQAGAVAGATLLLFYCFSGGLRADIWTDVAQFVVMVLSMATLFVGGVAAAGGWTGFWGAVESVGPGYTHLAPNGLQATALFIVGWIFGGIAAAGQPHLMVRYMSLRSASDVRPAWAVYALSHLTFVTLATLTAISARVFLPEIGDPELALPVMARDHLHEAFAGLMLAGLFAATMSTGDSQVLSCSATLSQDLVPRWAGSVRRAKAATLLVILTVLGMALFDDTSVFDLAVFAWAGLGVAFGPIVIVRALGGDPSERTVLAMIVLSVAAMLAWRQTGWQDAVYEALPGLLTGLLVYGASTFSPRRKVVPG